MKTKAIEVWDPIVRVFHWVLVAAFFIAYVTEDELMTLHAYAGYTIMGLLVVRVVWGLIGSRHARFSNFIYSPATTIAYLKDVFTLKAKRYVGHNPAGGWMIILMMCSLLLTTFTGLVVYGVEEQAGPLLNYVSTMPHWMGEAFEEVHEFFANFTLFLVFIHVGGVVVESFLHHENLARSMWTGKKEVRE
jgi:cytochrome b